MPEFSITTNIPSMLGVKETAKRFGISQNYARQLALSGDVKAVRVNIQSVADFFNNSYIKPSEPTTGTDINPIPVKL